MYSNPDEKGGRGAEVGFCRYFVDRLNSQFSSIWGTVYYQGSWFSITLADTNSELEATKILQLLSAFKRIILQYKGQKINGSRISFSKK